MIHQIREHTVVVVVVLNEIYTLLDFFKKTKQQPQSGVTMLQDQSDLAI